MVDLRLPGLEHSSVMTPGLGKPLLGRTSDCVSLPVPGVLMVFSREQPALGEVQAKAGASATLSCEVARPRWR